MDLLTPTPKLRFVNRGDDIPIPDNPAFTRRGTVKVLQQWWIDTAWMNPNGTNRGEWRDVPLEME